MMAWRFHRGLQSSRLLVALVLTFVLCGTVGRAAPAAWPKGPIGLRMECNGARFTIGTPLTGTETAGQTNPGDVITVDLISLRDTARGVGYLYTTGDGQTFVAERANSQAQVWDYAVMNAIVQSMSSFIGNAFDPRDNGFVAYPVKWDTTTAEHLNLRLTRCPAKS